VSMHPRENAGNGDILHAQSAFLQDAIDAMG
jgi:hypothetical protein